MVNLGTLSPTWFARAFGVNVRGDVIVGESGSESFMGYAFLWTPVTGMVNLNAYLADRGVDLAGWTLQYAASVSDDGRVIAGFGEHDGRTEAWVATIRGCLCIADVDNGQGSGMCDGGVNIDDLLYFFGLYAQGAPRADLDDGAFTGTPDGGVTIDDLLFFLFRFEQGC